MLGGKRVRLEAKEKSKEVFKRGIKLSQEYFEDSLVEKRFQKKYF